jgi:hypothetical protein
MVKCPKCNSHDVDPATVGLPGSMVCLDCGYLFPQVMSLFPKLIKTETSWPFPTSLVKKPLNDKPVKVDHVNNAQEAPF